jgi:hypothetical protein
VSFIPQHVGPDSLAAVLRTVFAAREYHWVGAGTSNAWVWLLEHLQRLVEWLEHLRLAFPVHYYILVGAMILLLSAMLAHLTWVVWRSLRPAAGVGAPAVMMGPVRDAAWHLAEALRLGAAGRFAEALAHRFLAAVLDLDARRVLQFHPSKTPAEYAREARLDEVGRSELADLVASLYRHVFGGAPCDAAEWQRFDARAVEIGLHAATR